MTPLRDDRITFVLPLRGDRDLETARRVLLPSLDLLFRLDDVEEILVIGRAEELARFDFADVVSAPLARRIRAVDEQDLIPRNRSLVPLSGYDRQQVLKLTVSGRVRTRLYCTLDSDVYLVTRCGLADWYAHGRAIYNRYPMDAHPKWWTAAAKHLGYRIRDFDRTHGFGVTPSLLFTDVARGVIEHLEGSRKGVAHAVRWRSTEYSLYWLYLLKNDEVAELYREGEPELIGQPLWREEEVPGGDVRAFVDAQFASEGRWFFSLIQSTSGVATPELLGYVREKIEWAAG